MALLTRTGPLTEAQQIQLFTVGLGEPLSIDVQLQGAQSLEVAMSLARAYERRTAHHTTPSRGMCHHIFILRPPPEHANIGDRLAGLYLDTATSATCATARDCHGGRTHRAPSLAGRD